MRGATSLFPRLLLPGKTLLILAGVLFSLQGCGGNSSLKPWHTKELSEEFSMEMPGNQVHTFGDYLALEQRLFRELDEKIYANSAFGPAHALERYSPNSSADPRRHHPNWNRSFELPADEPVGGVLLLHGMSDSPYSLRALGMALNQRGYQVVGLRLPGHGTVPSGLREITWQDMAAAVNIAMQHLASSLGSKPIHMIGYSAGASLALPFTHKPQQDNITHLRSVSTRHSYAETRYSPARVIGTPGADHFSDPDSPLLRRPEALHHRVALAASTLFFSVGAQGS